MFKKYLPQILITLGLAIFFIFNKDTDSSLGDGTDFKVDNIESIDKIFLAKKSTKENLLLEKGDDGVWMLNGKYRANRVMVKTLLETMQKMEVRGPVPKAMRNDVVRDMASMAVKVELYKNENKTKTFFVGNNAPDLNGTMMYNDGADNPFIVHIAGFQGFLKTRFLVSEKDWKSKHVFTYKLANIKSVKVNWIESPSKSFDIDKMGNGFIVKGMEDDQMNKLKLKAYLKQFDKIFYNGYPLNLTNQQVDSVYKSEPYLVIELTDSKNIVRKLAIHHKPIQVDTYSMFDEEGNPMDYEEDNFYAFVDDKKEIVEVQLYVMGKVMQERNYFLK